MIRIITLILLLLINVKTTDNFIYVGKEINIFKEIEAKDEKVLAIYKGNITAYGPDCAGCTTGKTASGYNVLNGNIYYNDKEYGKLRIVASDKSLPFGTIVRIKGLDITDMPILAIVLDRGGAIGFDKKVYFDLLYKSENDTLSFGIKYATFEILRRGY